MSTNGFSWSDTGSDIGANEIPAELYAVHVKFLEPLLGGTPKNESVYATWIDLADRKANKQPDEEMPPPTEERGWTGFPTDEDGVFLWDYQVKGNLKEEANTLKEIIGVKNARVKLDNFVQVKPRRVRLHVPEGTYHADGRTSVLERPLRAQTMQGERVALARSDMIPAGAELFFVLEIIKGPISAKHVRTLMEYGKGKGMGQWRNGGFGRYEVLRFQQVESVPEFPAVTVRPPVDPRLSPAGTPVVITLQNLDSTLTQDDIDRAIAAHKARQAEEARQPVEAR